MTKIKLLLLFFLMGMTLVLGQQKKYITHTVKRGETMKSIARQYKLTTREMLKLNPGVGRKPEANTRVVVPNPDFGKVVEVEAPALRTYRVKPKETEFGIARMHGVTLEALREANPELSDGLKIGMLLKIPEATITTLKDSVNYVLHTVVKDDTYFNLTRRYDVSQEDLVRLNPVLEEEGLRLGLLLKIKPRPEEEETEPEVGRLVEDLDLDRQLRVAFMLPYQLNKISENDSIVEESFRRQRSLQNIATDFQLGSLYAIDSLRKMGLSVDVDFFDTEYSRFDTENARQKLQFLIGSNRLRTYDAIVGPLFFENAHWMSERVNTLLLTPFYSARQEGLESRNLVKTSPDDRVYEEKVMAFMEKTYAGENILVINDTLTGNQSKLWRVVNRLKNMDSVSDIAVLRPKESMIDPELFKIELDSMGPNWVVIISNENLTTSAAVNGLKGFAERIDIDLFAFKKGRNFDAIDNHFLGKLNFVFATSEFLDPERMGVGNFYAGYERRNHAWPSTYSVRGFDVTYDLLVRLASSGPFGNGITSGLSDRVSGRFDFKRKLLGGYQNHGVYLLRYNEELEHEMLDIDQEPDQ
jgi:LysM repeat protein